MSKFEVGKAYNGWCRERSIKPATLVVVDIAEDRKTLLAVHPTWEDPRRAYEYHIVWDDRFGEKIVDRTTYVATVVWRADKCLGDGAIPEGWFSDKKRNREDGARRAAKTRADKAKILKMEKSIDMAKFLEIYSRLERWESDRVFCGVTCNAETLSQYLTVWKGEMFQDSRALGWCMHVGVRGIIPCETYFDEIDKCEKNYIAPHWGFSLYADRIRGRFSFSHHIEGEEFKAIFSDVK